MASLLRKNRMKKGEKLAHGRVVWLRYIRPASTPIEIKDMPRAEQPVMVKKGESKGVMQPDLVPQTNEKATVTLNNNKPVERLPAPEAVKTEVAVKKTPATDEPPSPIERRALMEPVKKSPASVAQIPANDPQGTTVSTEPADEERIRTHQVTAGQSLYSIAKLYAVSVADLRRWNNLSETDGLKIGQQLSVGEGGSAAITPQPPKTVTAQEPTAPQTNTIMAEYIVQPGDTLYKISKKHGITVQQLMDWNGKTAPSVSVGEKLKVKQI
jgi:LysM repeat protein